MNCDAFRPLRGVFIKPRPMGVVGDLAGVLSEDSRIRVKGRKRYSRAKEC